MARFNDMGEGRLEAPRIRPSDIIIKPGFNYRDTDSDASRAHIAWLKESIRLNGVQEPIRVEYVDGKVYLVNGECRVKACLELEAEGLEVRIPAALVKGDEASILAQGMIANGALPPTKMEFGAAAERLEKLGWPMDRIAGFVPPHLGLNISKAKRYVAEAIALHQAPIAVKQAVKQGVDGIKVSEAAALAITNANRIMAPEIIKEEVAKAKAEGKTEVKRAKGPGEVAEKKAEFIAFNDKLLELADMVCQMVISQDCMLDDIEKKARQYLKLRGVEVKAAEKEEAKERVS
jgi:ParB family chromosome partitioning protein